VPVTKLGHLASFDTVDSFREEGNYFIKEVMQCLSKMLVLSAEISNFCNLQGRQTFVRLQYKAVEMKSWIYLC
jgi:hypothetical protein